VKVAVPAMGKGLESRVSEAFGRCPFFVMVDVKDGKVEGAENLENSARESARGAGTTAVQLIADGGAEAAMAIFLGPRAFSALSSLGIKAYRASPGTVRENAERLASGGAEGFDSPRGGRWQR
jgi:predicted Fe-Mo cluster-binding NifX family protein